MTIRWRRRFRVGPSLEKVTGTLAGRGNLDALTKDDDHSEMAADRITAARGFHEVLRRTRADQTRIYHLRAVAGGAELWRIEGCPGEPLRSVKESHFNGPEEAAAFLEEVRRALTAGGWR